MVTSGISSADWTELAARHPDLKPLPPQVAGKVKRLSLASEGLLFRCGERPRAIYYLIAGEVHMVRRTRNGGTVVMSRTQQGFFAEAGLYAKAYGCDAVAVMPSSILMFPLSVYQEMLDDNKEFRRSRFAQQACDIRRLCSRCERLSLPTAQERLFHYIETEGKNGAIELEQPVKALAAELGLTHETLYRTLAQMERNGVLKRSGSRIELL
jgi:CRP-like cAMP-binding protein